MVSIAPAPSNGAATQHIYSASAQWSSRPAEERFRSLADMQVSLQARKERSSETGALPIPSMRVMTAGENLALANDRGAAILNNYTLGQLAQGIGAPAGYLRSLPAELAAECLNTGLPKYPDKSRNLLIEETDQGNMCRAITSNQYSRYWDCDVVTDLLNTLDIDGWRVPPARPYPGCPAEDMWQATAEDILPGDTGSLSIRIGDTCGPAGLYVCFVGKSR